jgi:FixJ family two-component response regulator
MGLLSQYLVVSVDDDYGVRESIRNLVESAGYAPEVFCSGEEFLLAGILARASCLIIDVRMPGMDGIELQRRVRLERPALPVIFVSAHNDKDTRHRALNGGAIDFLHKPFDGANLLETIYRAVTIGGKHDESIPSDVR